MIIWDLLPDVSNDLLWEVHCQFILLWMLKERSEGAAMLAAALHVVVQPMPWWMLQDVPKLEAITHTSCQELDHAW